MIVRRSALPWKLVRDRTSATSQPCHHHVCLGLQTVHAVPSNCQDNEAQVVTLLSLPILLILVSSKTFLSLVSQQVVLDIPIIGTQHVRNHPHARHPHNTHTAEQAGGVSLGNAFPLFSHISDTYLVGVMDFKSRPSLGITKEQHGGLIFLALKLRCLQKPHVGSGAFLVADLRKDGKDRSFLRMLKHYLNDSAKLLGDLRTNAFATLY